MLLLKVTSFAAVLTLVIPCFGVPPIREIKEKSEKVREVADRTLYNANFIHGSLGSLLLGKTIYDRTHGYDSLGTTAALCAGTAIQLGAAIYNNCRGKRRLTKLAKGIERKAEELGSDVMPLPRSGMRGHAPSQDQVVLDVHHLRPADVPRPLSATSSAASSPTHGGLEHAPS